MTTVVEPRQRTVVVDASGMTRRIGVRPTHRTRSEVPDILAAVDLVR
jgi:hypothetical protein